MEKYTEVVELPRLNLQLFAEDTGEENKETNIDGEGGAAGEQKEDDKRFNQADIDKAIKSRLDRENKKFQKQLDDLKSQFTAGGDSEGNANDGGQNDTNEATVKAQKLVEAANQRLVEATATTEAVKLGVDPKYIADVVRLANLAGVEVGEDGTIDTGAISKGIDEVLKRVPLFKTTTETEGGFKVGGEGKKEKTGSNGWGDKKATTTQRWNKTNRW